MTVRPPWTQSKHSKQNEIKANLENCYPNTVPDTVPHPPTVHVLESTQIIRKGGGSQRRS